MKKLLLLLPIMILLSCDNVPYPAGSDTGSNRGAMRSFIRDIDDQFNKDGILGGNYTLINNGASLAYKSTTDSTIMSEFLNYSIDGIIQNGLQIEKILNSGTTRYDSLSHYLNIFDSSAFGNFIGTNEYYYYDSQQDSILTWNNQLGYKTFTLQFGENFDVIPPYNSNGLDSISTDNISSLNQVKNFLFYTDVIAFQDSTKQNPSDSNTTVERLKKLNFDLIIIKPDVIRIRREGQGYTTSVNLFNNIEMDSLKVKENGNRRLVFAAVDIAHADSRLSYWKSSWNDTLPTWMSPTSELHIYDVDYRNSEWQDALLKDISYAKHSYITQIKEAGFDGIVLIGADVFTQYENDTTTISN